MDKLPIYRFIVGEDDEAQLEAVAFVDTPAIEMNWQAFNTKQYSFKIHSGRIGNEINVNHLVITNY